MLWWLAVNRASLVAATQKSAGKLWELRHFRMARRLWRERDRLELYVIACRSSGVRPRLPVDVDPQNSRMRYLADAINDGRLIAASGDVNANGPGDGHMVQIRHSDLRAFAEREGNESILRFTEEWSPPSVVVVSSVVAAYAAEPERGEPDDPEPTASPPRMPLYASPLADNDDEVALHYGSTFGLLGSATLLWQQKKRGSSDFLLYGDGGDLTVVEFTGAQSVTVADQYSPLASTNFDVGILGSESRTVIAVFSEAVGPFRVSIASSALMLGGNGRIVSNKRKSVSVVLKPSTSLSLYGEDRPTTIQLYFYERTFEE